VHIADLEIHGQDRKDGNCRTGNRENWKLTNWTVEGAIIVSKNKIFNALYHTNLNEYNVCNIYQRLATPNGVSYTNVLNHIVFVSNVSLQIMRIRA